MTFEADNDLINGTVTFDDTEKDEDLCGLSNYMDDEDDFDDSNDDENDLTNDNNSWSDEDDEDDDDDEDMYESDVW